MKYAFVYALCLAAPALCQAGPAAQPELYKAAGELLLLPTPRELALEGGEEPLAGWEIVVPADAAMARVGASEINRRIVELGGVALPVVAEGTGKPAIFVGRWWDPAIRALTQAARVMLTPVDPGEQGYVIRLGRDNGRPFAVLGGSDDQGALYACVTFRALLLRSGSGVAARRAAVRDWPDFKVRINARLELQSLSGAKTEAALRAAVGEAKEELDFCLRHKINYVQLRAARLSGNAPADVLERQRKAIAEVAAYARERGIRLRSVGGVEITEYLTPEQRKTAVEREKGSLYEFAAFDAHVRHARHYAGILRLHEAAMFSLHPFDGGGYEDPEMWSKRSPAARAMYGDDRARASLEQFTLYFEVVRKAVPGIELEAVVYPYHFQFLQPDFPERFKEWANGLPRKTWYRSLSTAEEARRQQKDLLAYHTYMAKHLPDDVSIVFREAGRKEFLDTARLYGGHPITIWIYPDRNNGWMQFFSPQVRMARTFWVPGRRDNYYVASSWRPAGDERFNRLAQQEYLWNTGHPDASEEFTIFSRFYERAGREITPFQRTHLIPRIARMLYGEDAPAFARLAELGVSFTYVMNPAAVGKEGQDTEYFDPIDKYMDEVARNMAEAHKAFAALLPKSSREWTHFYHRATGLAAVKARLEAAAGRCRRSADPAAPARQTLDELPALERECAAVRAATKAPLPARWKELEEFSPLKMKAEFEKFLARR